MNAQQLAKSLTQQYGPLLKGKELMIHLGFSTPGSFARARKRGLLEVKVFDLEGRRGPFALTEEVAEWVAGLSGASQESRRAAARKETAVATAEAAKI